MLLIIILKLMAHWNLFEDMMIVWLNT
uniref:Uncharacterized protein n=1 Tax=Rhizophora mucronata TaxID=61149 RepID=A0A2P2M0E5_RHIMU